MTEPVNANAALHTVHEKQMFQFPQRHSRALPPSLPLEGLSPVEPISSFSQGGGGTELRWIKLWLYNSASFTAMSRLDG